MDSGPEIILQMKNITKTFPGVLALEDVSIEFERGKVHAVMGENGAGKSTLMKILAGIYKADQGEILINDRIAIISNPKEAITNGISMIHQELSPIPYMTIAENIFVGREPQYGIFPIVNRKEMRRLTQELFSKIGIRLNPDQKMATLSIAEMQLVEILKAVSFNSEIIIMDEPTSAITDREVDKLFEIIRMLSAKGKTVIYISHKMDEIFKICDYVTVLRDGRYIDTKPIGELNKQKLISLMVGRELNNIFPKIDTEIGDIALEVRNLTKKGKFKDISFFVKKGEILGLSGLMGAGRTEVVEAIFGVDKADSGEIIIDGRPARINSPADAIRYKIGLISEDRKLMGLNLKSSIKNNITMASLGDFCYLKQIIRMKQEQKSADQQIRSLKIKTPTRNQIVSALSGGNQQKVVIAQWLLCNPDVLILDEPTRGIDVGAKSEIHKIMGMLAKDGKAIIMISSEMQEILGMSDRVIVLHEGRVTGEFTREELDQECIMGCATGHRKGEMVV
ncbi:MAG: sugar ABC transporter ATP-binding protein [Saccharofermentanales bacterium]